MINVKNKAKIEPNKEIIKFILNLFNLKKFIEAKKEIDKQLIKYPNSSILFNIIGAVYAGQNKLDKALNSYKKAIKINPEYAQAYNNLGTALHQIGKAEESIDNYQIAIKLDNNFSEAFNNLGNAVRDLNKPEKAIDYFKKAIKINSNFAEAYNNLGCAYEELGNKKDALNNFKIATKIKPNYAEAYNNLGMVFCDLAKFNESLLSYNKAININPTYEKAYNNIGNLFNNLGKYDEATKAYYKAIKIKPDYAKAYSNLLFNLNYKNNFDPDLYLSEAKNFALNCKNNNKKFSFKHEYQKNPTKLRIGLMSSDFGNHPGGYFTLSTLKELRKKNFDLISYAVADRNDDISDHFKPLFIKWNSVKKKSDEELVEQIIKDRIHILIDLQGHSAKNRLPIFIYKPAPVQISWLGQGSTGISEIDYFIGSPHITPKNEEKHYVEKVIRLPEISQCFTAPNFDVKINILPAIKNKFITFGSFNKLTKTNDEVITLWSQILLSIPNSKILLKNKDLDSKEIYDDVIKKFEKNGINKKRIILEGRSQTRKELLECYNKIDISLDPFPFQGNTTSIESAWMGVPVITLKGDRYLFHFGESINANLNMHDWIANNKKEYISKAIKFSSNLEQLSLLRMNLREIALKSPNFNASRFADHFSKMLWNVWSKFSKKV